ncbi:cyanobactin biosynthesis PatC/TenC/TruC family protein [Nostoc sp. CHAB 5784]|uniref:mannose-binding lectin n=1 Tax=Nostoc mirabile TaxID=2907820 RepID=UPI001E57DD1E|nr:LamG-like jellyroll fold domain-containing protein [Nostoc mirabile]MCC5669244.1 cyanobactin biosynthesis PatC/TenC/TruC family protein [Nostoc mirabile CHAB5784]
MADNTVKFGDAFYLKHATNQYLVAVDRGTYNWPQLGNTGKVTLQLVGNSEGEVVRSQSRIKIKTTELATGNNDILGAFSNSHDCYYWQDGYDENKQSWIITKVSGKGGAIRYDERVYLTNSSYTNQKLCADTSSVGYITTAENTKDWWILESAVSVSSDSPPAPSDQESSSSPTASESLLSQPASAPPNVAPSPAAPTQPSDAAIAPGVISSTYQQSCTDISIQGNVLSATCRKSDGSLNNTSIVLKGIENIDGELKLTDPNKPSSYQETCTEISIQGNILSATCKRADGSPNKSSIVLDGIENADGNLRYTGTTEQLGELGETATASPNISPSPSPVSPEQFIPIEQSGTLPEPASAPPNVAPSPPQPSVESSPPVTPAPVIAPPIPPVRLQGSQMVLVLDEKHQGISAGGGALRPQGNFTIEAWVYPATNAGKQVIFADGETLFYLEGGELKFQTPLSSEAIASVGAGIASGSWYHVAVTRVGSRPGNTKLYINGVHNDNQKAISPVLSFGNTYLGGQPNVADSRFQGKLLEVRVWRYARSQAEIEANQMYPMTGRELGLVRYWSLNQTVGSTLQDNTTNRAVGTLSGNPVWEEAEIPLKLKLDPQERLTRSTGLEDYGYWFKEMAKQQKTEADPPFLRGRIWR